MCIPYVPPMSQALTYIHVLKCIVNIYYLQVFAPDSKPILQYNLYDIQTAQYV